MPILLNFNFVKRVNYETITKRYKQTFYHYYCFDQRRLCQEYECRNIGAFCAEHGLRTLLIDTDTQPTLSSYYELEYQAPGGTYEFLHFKDVDPTHIISRTAIPNLDLIQSNDPSNKISPMLRDSPDGALRFSLLLQKN